MKSIISNILGVMVILLAFSSCEDWLDMPSESSTDTSSVFESVSRAEMAVVGAYATLHSLELGYQLLMGTDEIASTESNSKYFVSNYDYTTTTNTPASTYTYMYKAIEYANVCIANLPGMSASSDSEQAQIDALLGESYAVRAYAYWNLVRFWGDVPFTETPTSELTTFTSGRESRDTIYDHCIADLQRAIELLPWLSEGYVDTPERFTKGAAYGILARVALYAAGYSLRWDLSSTPYDASTVKIAQRDDSSRIKELYQIAADACKAVIDQGENGLLDDYDQIFRNLGNQAYDEETMFEYGWYSTNAADVRTGYTNGIPASGTSSVLGKVTTMMMAWPTFYFEYEEGDQRRDVSICNYGMVLSTSSDSYQMNTYAGMGVGKYRVNWKETRGSSDSKRDIDWPILRYADVLLMYAEALNEINNGPTSAAISAVKQVRARAFGSESLVGDIPTTYDDFKDFLIQERKLELSGEGLRKTDLCRWGILVDHLTAEKEKLIRLCNREEEFADVNPYWAYRLTSTPQLDDPTIALEFVEMSEDDVTAILTDDELTTLHTINNSSKGYVTHTLYEGSDGTVYFEETDGATGYEYTILNMFSIHSIKQKGNLSVVDNDTWDGVNFIGSENSWITGSSGVFYGMVKNMVEIMPFNQTSIIDVNAGLTDQQHPCY